MFPKLCVLIISVGVIGGGLLTTRQLRIQAAHELANVQRRVAEHDRQLWQLRVEIAERTLPEHIATKLEQLGPMAPIGPHRYQEFVQAELERSLDVASIGDGESAGKTPSAKSGSKAKPKPKARKVASAN